MVVSLTLGVRLVPNNFQRIKIDGIDLEGKVENLRIEAAKKINHEKDNIELIYCGNILEDNEVLSSYGVKPNVMVHLLKKKCLDIPKTVRKLSEADVQQLVLAFRAFKLSPNYRTALQRLSRPEVLENIIAATPGLSEDPVAIAMIQDPELLVHMTDADIVRRIADLHPSLADAANHIAAAVHEEAANINPNTPGPSSGYSYSLEALSDDEEMDSSSSDGQSSGRQGYSSGITVAQLEAALASATPSATTPGPSSNSNSVITPEMFSHAMQQAFANVGGTGVTSNDGEETLDQIARRLAPQLQQMRELGLTNIATNIQALQATNGDVQAAIDLVFSGVMSPDL